MSETNDDELRALDAEECWRLLADGSLGRFVTAAGGQLEIFPVNYLVHERGVYFASAPGTKLAALTVDTTVAFEADGEQRGALWERGTLWSVVIHGTARRLAADDEIEESGVLELDAWAPGGKHNYVRIEAHSITGRSFPAPRHGRHRGA
jgi:uncharacterized protein